MTLNELAIKYGSDKSDMPSPNYPEPHDYCRLYEQYLPNDLESILEIGCMHGASEDVERLLSGCIRSHV